MLIKNEVEVDADPGAVYSSLLDLDGVAPCIPGATLGDAAADGTRDARIEVSFGPMRFAYEGTVRIADRNSDSREAVLEAAASETSGEGSAKARIAMRVGPLPRGSLVLIETDLRVTGGIAQIGRGMIEELGQELLDEFGARLADGIADGTLSGERSTAPRDAGGGPAAPSGVVATAAPQNTAAATARARRFARSESLSGGRLLLRVLRRQLRRWLRAQR